MNKTTDLNLLIVFDAIWRLRNVSKAAQSIGLSQPAVSNALRRLREQFQDRLFVRTARGMLPTPAAQELGPTVSEALARIGAGLSRRREFDPVGEEHTFTVTLSDIGSIVFLPRLLEYCNRVAPGIRIRSMQRPVADIAMALESGEVDLAIGFVPDLHTGVYQQLLFHTDYVCLVRKGHPVIGDRITRAQFMGATHAVAEVAESEGKYVIERELQRMNLKIGLRLPHVLALPMIIGATDMVATVARPLAIGIHKTDNIKLLEPPIRLPRPSIRQFWHERYHHDPANRWLRGKIHALFYLDHPWAAPLPEPARGSSSRLAVHT